MRDFLDGPVAKTPCSQCRGLRFNPWSGNYIPHFTTKSLHVATKTQHSQINRQILKRITLWCVLKKKNFNEETIST